MPKQRITKKMIVDAAFALARSGGLERLTVTDIAAKLGCSVQPIYSYCQSMEGLRSDVSARARQFVQGYVAERIDPKDPFFSTGRAYIRLAKEEPCILKMFLFQSRTGISSLEDLYRFEAAPQMAQAIADSLHISAEQAKQLHLDMLIYTIGIGAIYSVTTPGIPADEIYARQERAYQIFLKNILEEQND